MVVVLLIIIVIGIAVIEVRLRKKQENDQKIMEKLDVLIEELKKKPGV